ncbi:hypothetical protein HAPG_00076 [Halorubrum phage GNf2]|nr:hypothetical protein HAPG_00076 [Halorubrum phage GNf2]
MATQDRLDDLAETLENRFADSNTIVKPADDEVFFTLNNADNRPPLSGMDDACILAFDRGFVPRGIVDSGAVRFQLRE